MFPHYSSMLIVLSTLQTYLAEQQVSWNCRSEFNYHQLITRLTFLSELESRRDNKAIAKFLLTFSGARRLKRPQLFLFQAGAVGIQFEAERFSGHVFMLTIDQANRPPALLLVLRQDITVRMIEASVHHVATSSLNWVIYVCERKRTRLRSSLCFHCVHPRSYLLRF